MIALITMDQTARVEGEGEFVLCVIREVVVYHSLISSVSYTGAPLLLDWSKEDRIIKKGGGGAWACQRLSY